MNGLTAKELKTLARQQLSAATFPPKKLTLWYSGIVLGLNLLSVILDWITGSMIDSTGGLSGLGPRAVLDTVSTVFSLAVQIATPLLAYCCIHLARQTQVEPKSLTMGPRRWAVILRHGLLVGGIFLAIGYAALQVASMLFMLLPSSEKAVELVYTIMEDPALLEGNISPQLLEEMVDAFMPVYIIGGVLFLVVFIPISYRLRLSSFRIMEETPVGAVKSVLESWKLMKGNCIPLFKLDLSFWWFYLLQSILFLLMTGISLLVKLTPGWYVVVSLAYSLAMLALEYSCLASVQTTYAVFYDNLLQACAVPQIEE